MGNGGSSEGSGLTFGRGGVGSKVEKNVITGNAYGVEYDVAGGDLGGDVAGAGSTGGNVISCNTHNDLVSRATTTITITAAYNLWDHAPPVYGSGSPDPSMDIFLTGVHSNVVSADAQVYDPANPPPSHP